MESTKFEIICAMEQQEKMVQIPYNWLNEEIFRIPLIIDIKRKNKSKKWKPTKKFLNHLNAQLNPRTGVIAVEYYTVDTPKEEKESEMLIKKNARIAKEVPMPEYCSTTKEERKIAKILEKYKPKKFCIYEKTPWKKMLEV